MLSIVNYGSESVDFIFKAQSFHLELTLECSLGLSVGKFGALGGRVFTSVV